MTERTMDFAPLKHYNLVILGLDAFDSGVSQSVNVAGQGDAGWGLPDRENARILCYL
jgi:hypothetical protein